MNIIIWEVLIWGGRLKEYSGTVWSIYSRNTHLENRSPDSLQENLQNYGVMWWEGRALAQESGRFGRNSDTPFIRCVTLGTRLLICKKGVIITHPGGGWEGDWSHARKTLSPGLAASTHWSRSYSPLPPQEKMLVSTSLLLSEEESRGLNLLW